MKFGEWGEGVAGRYLENQGFTILERNFRCRSGEIDLIVQKGDLLCFVEVKSRKGTYTGYPSEAVTRTKQEHIRRVASYYLHTHRRTYWKNLRMDVIEVLRIGETTYLRHIEDAFGE